MSPRTACCALLLVARLQPGISPLQRLRVLRAPVVHVGVDVRQDTTGVQVAVGPVAPYIGRALVVALLLAGVVAVAPDFLGPSDARLEALVVGIVVDGPRPVDELTTVALRPVAGLAHPALRRDVPATLGCLQITVVQPSLVLQTGGLVLVDPVAGVVGSLVDTCPCIDRGLPGHRSQLDTTQIVRLAVALVHGGTLALEPPADLGLVERGVDRRGLGMGHRSEPKEAQTGDDENCDDRQRVA